jgi:hypothetical protein
MIPRRIEISLTGLHFGLLNTENICIRFFEKVRESLAKTGAEAVDVP